MHWMTAKGKRHSRIMHQMGNLTMVRKILYRRVMDEYPLHFGQLPILEYILEHPGCTQVEVAQQLFVTPSSIAQSTKRMQKEGLLEKHMRDENQRSKQLYVTERGAEVAAGCRKGFDAVDEILFTDFSDEEIQAMEGYVERMVQSGAGHASLDMEHLDFSAMLSLKHSGTQCPHGGTTHD